MSGDATPTRGRGEQTGAWMSETSSLLGTGLSLVAPGSGHVMAGELRRGAALVSASLFALPMVLLGAALETRVGAVFGVAAPAVFLVCLHVYAMVDFQRAARRAFARPAPAWLVTLAVVVGASYPCVLALAARDHVLAVAVVPTRSMEPTIAAGERVFVNRLAARRPPHRGEVWTFRSPETGALWIKRVIGLPGDRIEQRDDGVRVNGRPLARAAGQTAERLDGRVWTVRPAPNDEPGRYEVPEGCCFVLGDHRAGSRDSRHVGPIPLADLDGLVAGR